MNKLFVCLCTLLLIGFFACTKESRFSTHTVQIRVENKTSLLASNVVLGSESYGSLLPGQVSDYHSFKDLTYTPTVSFYDDSKLVQLIIGYCGTGLPQSSEPSYLEDGHYTYTISKDSSYYYGFGFSFTKE